MTTTTAFARCVKTRWSDFDANGHANNAAYLTYLEEARDQLFVSVGICRERTVLARTELVFRCPVALGTEELLCSVTCVAVGRSSIRTVESLSVAGTVVLDATSTSVLVDGDGRPTPVPDDARAQLERRPAVSVGEGMGA